MYIGVYFTLLIKALILSFQLSLNVLHDEVANAEV